MKKSKFEISRLLNLDRLIPRNTRDTRRVSCTGNIVLCNRHGRIIAKGALKDINEKSTGFEMDAIELTVNDVYYIEFLEPWHLILTKVKVVLRRIQPDGGKVRVGVEFIHTTPTFQEKLQAYLEDRRAELAGFGENEII